MQQEEPQDGDEETPQKAPHDNKPCKERLLNSIADGIVPADVITVTPSPTPVAALLLPEFVAAPSHAPERVVAPRPPPAAISLQVVRTHFLRI